MEPTDVDLTPALRTWAKKNGVRPIDLSNAMGWGYSHSWAVLRGEHKFTLDAIGKFIMVYGFAAMQEVFRIAKVDTTGVKGLNSV